MPGITGEPGDPAPRFLRLSGYIAVCQLVVTQLGDGPSAQADWRGGGGAHVGDLGGLMVLVQDYNAGNSFMESFPL